MNIEKEIFNRYSMILENLISYGFIKGNNKYWVSKKILDDTFRIDIEISMNGVVQGKIYDLYFNEEYTNHRIESQTGEFVNSIREQFKKVLIEISDHCFIKNYFITEQANRITNYIINKYQDVPEFIWKKFPGYGVSKNSDNKKWYALIMNINKIKIDKEDKEVEVINVKLSEEEIINLLSQQGFYKAYHMNKKNWITIILDNTVSDEEIIKYIDQSHEYTVKV